jgi:hypothetical protein
MNIQTVILITSFVLLLGCSDSKHYALDFLIEKEGDAKYVSIEKFNSVGHSTEITESLLSGPEGLYGTIMYPRLSVSNDPIKEAHREIANTNNLVVNNQIYNFLISIDIKSNADLYNLPGITGPGVMTFKVKRCEAPYPGGYRATVFSAVAKKVIKESGFYGYTLYVPSNMLASMFMLNNVGDLCVKFEFGRGSNDLYGGDSYDIKSNEVVIKVEEIEVILDEQGIAH